MGISKRILAIIILILFLLNNLMPIITYAEDNSGTQNSSQNTQGGVGREYEIKEEETWDVSENGDGSVIAKWTLKDRTLTISGSGKMKDWNGYSAGSDASIGDWHQTKYTKAIENVIIKNGITSIGSSAFDRCGSITNIEIPSSITDISWSAFYDCYSLTNIEIPSSVTSIRGSAFSGCSSLTNIEIPNSVTIIERYAFSSCSSLTNIEIPNSVTSIGDEAFYGCRSLTNIEIPSSVTSIGYRTFKDCNSLTNIEIPNSVTKIETSAFSDCNSLREIKVDSENQKYASIDGVLFNKDKTEIEKYPSDKEGTKYEIPSGVTSINSWAFSGCSSLTNIEIPSSVTSINSWAFSGCSSLTNIEIPSSVPSIGYGTFSSCSSLTNIEIPNGVTSIGAHAFDDCSKLTNIEIPSSVASIGNSAFKDCISLTNIEIPNSITSIADYAFDNDFNGIIMCYTNSEAHKYAESRKIWYKLLDNKESIYETKYKIREQGTWDISKNADESVIARWTLSDRTLRITGDGKMQDMNVNETPWCNIKYNDLIEKVIVENGVENIGTNVFYKCRNINNIEIQNSVTSIGSNAFSDCISLTNIELPSSVTTIDSGAFNGCSSLTNIKIPNSVTNIRWNAFYGCSDLREINVDSENQKYASIDGVLFNKDKTEILGYPSGKEGTKYEILNSVTSIGAYAFECCSSLTNIEIPNGVTSIGGEAFYGCRSLTNIEIPNGVTSIGGEAFYGCRSLTNIEIPSSVTSIGYRTFKDCNSLTNIEIPSSVTSIGERAFTGCSSLTNIKISNKVNNIDKEAFYLYNGILNVIKNSEAHRYAENNEIGYILYEEEIEVNFETNGFNQPQKEVSIGVNVNSTNTELDEDSLKYIWSTKEEVEKEEITNSFTNGEQIMSPKGVTGLYYLYVYAVAKNGKEIIEKSSGIMLDNTIPTINITYSTINPTNQNIIATISSNEKVQEIEGWTLSSDGLSLTKEYAQNTKENIIIKDIAGNEITTNVEITNIDKTKPTLQITYSKNEPTNQNVIVTITSNEKIQIIEGWSLSSDGLKLTKTYTANTITNGEEIKIKDIAGNEVTTKVEITNIDKTNPTLQIAYSTKEETEGNVTVTITSNEKIQIVDGWTLSSDGLKLTKEYKQNVEQSLVVKDLAGNVTEVKITINNIIKPDTEAPEVEITYSTKEITNQNIIVTITANEKVQGVSGWTLSNDGLKLTKTYTANTKGNGEEIVIKDLAGNETKKIIKVTNIDKTAPTITGINNNQKYFRKATPKITDENLNTVELLKDGVKVTNYTNGQEITGAGDYKLTATDKTGNSTIVNFSIYDIQTESYKEKTTGNENYLGKINEGEKTSKIETLLKNVSSYKITRNGTEIYSSTNKNNDQVLYTGDKIEFESQAYTIIVTGDINKDGKANIIDLAKCMKVVLGKKTLDTIEGLAADTNFDGKVNIVDLAKIRKLSLNN